MPEGAPVVFLYHTPDEILDIAATNRVDLYCAGHTHGGQVALPLYGALVTFSKFGKRYESGLYREGQTSLYVNRGLGMEGGLGPTRPLLGAARNQRDRNGERRAVSSEQ